MGGSSSSSTKSRKTLATFYEFLVIFRKSRISRIVGEAKTEPQDVCGETVLCFFPSFQIDRLIDFTPTHLIFREKVGRPQL